MFYLILVQDQPCELLTLESGLSIFSPQVKSIYILGTGEWKVKTSVLYIKYDLLTSTPSKIWLSWDLLPQILKVKTGAMAWTQNIPLQIVPGWSLPAHGQLSGLRCEELEALFLYWMLKRNLSSHKVAEASTERGKLRDLVFLLRDTT